MLQAMGVAPAASRRTPGGTASERANGGGERCPRLAAAQRASDAGLGNPERFSTSTGVQGGQRRLADGPSEALSGQSGTGTAAHLAGGALSSAWASPGASVACERTPQSLGLSFLRR